MLDELLIVGANILTALALLAGLFFMIVGAFGVVRFPDFYARSHAASKCVTLGLLGLLTALVLFVGAAATEPRSEPQVEVAQEMRAESPGEIEVPTTMATTKALLVLAFVFIAAPIGSHMLARAAHRARVAAWPGTLGDELADDETAANAALANAAVPEQSTDAPKR